MCVCVCVCVCVVCVVYEETIIILKVVCYNVRSC